MIYNIIRDVMGMINKMICACADSIYILYKFKEKILLVTGFLE